MKQIAPGLFLGTREIADITIEYIYSGYIVSKENIIEIEKTVDWLYYLELDEFTSVIPEALFKDNRFPEILDEIKKITKLTDVWRLSIDTIESKTFYIYFSSSERAINYVKNNFPEVDWLNSIEGIIGCSVAPQLY